MFLIFCFFIFWMKKYSRNLAKGPVIAPLDPNHARQEQDFSAYCLHYFEASCAILNEPDSWLELPIDLCIANCWMISSSRAHVGNNVNLLVDLEIDWFWCCDAWQANSRVFHNLHDLGFVTSPWYTDGHPSDWCWHMVHPRTFRALFHVLSCFFSTTEILHDFGFRVKRTREAGQCHPLARQKGRHPLK